MRSRRWIKGEHGYFAGSVGSGGKSAKKVDKSGKSGIINTGGKITDKNYMKVQEYEQQAKDFYNCRIRSDDDIKLISQNTDFSYDDISAVKRHIMEDTHLFEDGSVRKFDADIDIALAWQRLMQGHSNETDILLVNHELCELNYIKKTGCSYEKAHRYATKKYDWQSAVDLLIDTDDIDNELLK